MNRLSWASTECGRAALHGTPLVELLQWSGGPLRPTFDAAEEFLAAGLHAYREHLAPAGTRLKKIRVGRVEREV